MQNNPYHSPETPQPNTVSASKWTATRVVALVAALPLTAVALFLGSFASVQLLVSLLDVETRRKWRAIMAYS